MEKIDACSSADVYFVLYSTTDRSSFREAALIIKYLLETRNVNQAAIFLIATKKDLKYEQDVTEYEGRLLAMELGCEFYIISSYEGFDGTQDVLRGSLRFTLNNKNNGSKSPLMTRVRKGLKNRSHTSSPSPQVIESRERTSTLWYSISRISCAKDVKSRDWPDLRQGIETIAHALERIGNHDSTNFQNFQVKLILFI